MFARSCLIVAACLAVGGSILQAAPKESTAPPADFAQVHREWKGLIARLTQIQQRYRTDSNADKKALEAEFETKLEQAKALEPKLGVLAEKAYLASPNTDKDVDEYLFNYLKGLVGSDDFEAAARLVRILIDHDYQHKLFNYLAGLTFFATNDFDDAQKYLKLADESTEIDQNGKRYLASIDSYKTLWAKEQEIRAAEDKANNLPQVKLATSKGDIVVQLYENEAPQATANFISLVEKKYYDGLKFHRVLPGFMAQAGDPKGDGTGGPGYTIPDEFDREDRRTHFRGTLSMAKSAEKNSGGSQFFLTFLPTSHLDGKHTAFGRIIEGSDVLAKLQRIQPGEPGTPDKIIKATVLRKRDHKYEPLKRPDKK